MIKRGLPFALFLGILLSLMSCTGSRTDVVLHQDKSAPPLARLQNYDTFAFRAAPKSLSSAIENQVQTHFRNLLETKGYSHDPDSAQFYVILSWTIEPSDPLFSPKTYITPAAKTSPYAQVEDETKPDHLYFHELSVELLDAGTGSKIWQHIVGTIADTRDFRITSNMLVKDAVTLLPTLEPQPREGDLLDDDNVEFYARNMFHNRDFTLPGFPYYVGFDLNDEDGFDINRLRSIVDDEQLLPLYADMLESAVYYTVSQDETLKIYGRYMVDGEPYNLRITADPGLKKYIVSDMSSVGGSEFNVAFATAVDETITREEELQKFRRDKLEEETLAEAEEEEYQEYVERLMFQADSSRWLPVFLLNRSPRDTLDLRPIFIK